MPDVPFLPVTQTICVVPRFPQKYAVFRDYSPDMWRQRLSKCWANKDFATRRATFGTGSDAPSKPGNGGFCRSTKHNRHWDILSMIAWSRERYERTLAQRSEERVPFGRRYCRFPLAKPKRIQSHQSNTAHRLYTQIASHLCTTCT